MPGYLYGKQDRGTQRDWNISERSSDIFYSDGAMELSLNPVVCILLQKTREGLIKNVRMTGSLVRETMK